MNKIMHYNITLLRLVVGTYGSYKIKKLKGVSISHNLPLPLNTVSGAVYVQYHSTH